MNPWVVHLSLNTTTTTYPYPHTPNQPHTKGHGGEGTHPWWSCITSLSELASWEAIVGKKVVPPQLWDAHPHSYQLLHLTLLVTTSMQENDFILCTCCSWQHRVRRAKRWTHPSMG